MNIPIGETVVVRPGDHFNILLPCGTLLNVEQTQDDFSICRGNGVVAYTRATSEAALLEDKQSREYGGEDLTQTTGRN